jgi:hypothetical protein
MYMTSKAFEFTFETKEERRNWEWQNELAAYDIVRVKVCYDKDGGSIDFPIKDREEFDYYMKWFQERGVHSLKIYEAKHCFEDKARFEYMD